MTLLRRPLVVAAVLALGAAACAPDDDPAIPRSGDPGAGDTTTDSEATTGGEATIVGENTSFDVTTLDAAVGETLTLTFDNRDDGIQHNLHVTGTAAGDAMTEITEGPVTQTLDVTFDEAGDFDYLCDVHPDQMRGTITVAEEG